MMRAALITLGLTALALPLMAGCGGSVNAAGFSAGQFQVRAQQLQATTKEAIDGVHACLPDGGGATTRAEAQCVGAHYRTLARALDGLAIFAARYQATEPAGPCQQALKEVSRLGGTLGNDFADVARRFLAGDIARANALVLGSGAYAGDARAWLSRTAEMGTDLGGACG